MRLALAQQNPTIGDLGGNVDKLRRTLRRAMDQHADLVVAPELAITGYSPRDLLDRPSFVRDAMAQLAQLASEVGEVPLVVGAVVAATGDPLGPSSRIANGCVVLQRGRVAACHRKVLLPTYDVFDDARYFVPGAEPTVTELCGRKVALSVCEDIWNDKQYWQAARYDRDPVAEAVAKGCDLIINVSASPFDRDKPAERLAMLGRLATRHGCPIVYVNQVGGNDGIVYDGRSLVVNARGELGARLAAFTESLGFARIEGREVHGDVHPEADAWQKDTVRALELGLADYVAKCGFRSVVLGLSGGIDSAVTATLATRALGPDRVIGVAMPSRYSSQHSLDDAYALAKNLGIRIDQISIEPIFGAYLEALAAPFRGLAEDVTEENLQARIRGALLMAYSNKLGALLLTTGNKSELAVGYSTLYGDMCGGLALISDVYKTDVYELAHELNRGAASPIPQPSLTKPPSAELRPMQRDEDSLPPYPVLDRLLRGYVDEAKGVDELVRGGLERELVLRIAGMVDRAEYKRRQAPPGIRVTRKAFGEGRRLPIAQRYQPA